MMLSRGGSYVPLFRLLGLLGSLPSAVLISTCHSSIYCSGQLLHRVQMARVFEDSKKFVDMRLLDTENATLSAFDRLMKRTNDDPTRQQLAEFINNYFTEGNELEIWSPPDYNPNPPILADIKDPNLRLFAKDVIQIWANLGRKVAPDIIEHPEKYSFLYVPNGFIVPGGRFKEMYYWDSFWIIRGLLISGMTDTARGMIENLLKLVETYGYVPNGSRVYYLGRSQPPLLAAMVASYYAATNNLEWVAKHLPTVERELHSWLNNKKVTLKMKDKKYVLLRYLAERTPGPRPESYYEDYLTSRSLPTEKSREDFYFEMKCAAETGWDFSTRWFITADGSEGNLTDVHASRIVPVDLNSIFAGALQLAGDFNFKLKDRRKAEKWWSLATYWRSAIDSVLWDPDDGVWYDYDAEADTRRKQFYPSCVTPLWAGAVEDENVEVYAAQLVKYLLKSGGLNYPGGIPTSFVHSGEQWDYPNAWPPLQSIVIGGLDASRYPEAKRLAQEQANLWIRANYLGYAKWQKMFEKYDVMVPGKEGEGGEYTVQDGFGWTNGVALELLQRYGSELVLAMPNELNE